MDRLTGVNELMAELVLVCMPNIGTFSGLHKDALMDIDHKWGNGSLAVASAK